MPALSWWEDHILPTPPTEPAEVAAEAPVTLVATAQHLELAAP